MRVVARSVGAIEADPGRAFRSVVATGQRRRRQVAGNVGPRTEGNARAAAPSDDPYWASWPVKMSNVFQ